MACDACIPGFQWALWRYEVSMCDLGAVSAGQADEGFFPRKWQPCVDMVPDAVAVATHDDQSKGCSSQHAAHHGRPWTEVACDYKA